MDFEKLESLVNERLSIREIANRLDTGFSTVRYWLRVHDLKTWRGPKGALPKDRDIPRLCSLCGATDPNFFYGNVRYRCKSCHNRETWERQQNTRAKALKCLGGKCVDCGYYEHTCALDIHHLDPSIKDTGFSHMSSWKWERVEIEIKKCILLCKNCHAVRHQRNVA